MLEKEKAIDAVLIATPDHLHAYVSIFAMKAGKHVYCEKPLTRNIWEARAVARVAKETGVATQMGNHGRSSEGHRQTAEWIWDGAIGQVREVHAWGGAGGFARGSGRPEGTPDVPAGLNWDLWLGPSRDASLPPGLCALQLARVVGLRRRRAAGPGAPPPRPRVQRAQAGRPADRGSHGPRRGHGGLLDRSAGDLPVRPPRKHGPRDGLLVRRRPASADAARHRPGRPRAAPRRRGQRHPLHRGEGDHHLRGMVGDAPPAAPRAAPRVQAPREDPRRGSRDTTPTGSRRARAGRRRAATSSTARGCASSSCSAAWRSARRSS